MVNLAALIATGGDEITAVLTAVGPNVGVFKMVIAADPLATALGISLAAGDDDDGDSS